MLIDFNSLKLQVVQFGYFTLPKFSRASLATFQIVLLPKRCFTIPVLLLNQPMKQKQLES